MRARFFLVLFFMVLGCGGPERSPQPTGQVDLIIPSPDIKPFFVRQTVLVTHGDQEHSIDAVIQYDGKTIRTVFLDPAMRPAVVLEQSGTEFTASGPHLDYVSFDPRWVMQVIGLALFISPLQPLDFEKRELQSAVGPIYDTAAGGRIVGRKVKDNETEIEYTWDGRNCPARILITNHAQGYVLEIQSVQCEEVIQ